jgi:hypothetical protein
MKGFIELTIYDKRVAVAISNIVGIRDRREEGSSESLPTTITLNTGIESIGAIIYPDLTYDEVLALIEAAQ